MRPDLLQHISPPLPRGHQVIEEIRADSKKHAKTVKGGAHKLGVDGRSSALVAGVLELKRARIYLDKVTGHAKHGFGR